MKNESVGDFLQEGLEKKSDQIVDPVFTGIYAGDIYNLSKNVLGEIADYELLNMVLY